MDRGAAARGARTGYRGQVRRAAPAFDRFSLAIDVIDRVPRLQVAGAHVKETLRNQQIECQRYAYEWGIDKPEVDQWAWPS